MQRHTCISISFPVAFMLLLVSGSASAFDHNGETGDSIWPMYNHDARGTRFNDRERTLSPTTVGKLYTEWVFSTPNAVSGTPIVVGNMVIAGDFDGNVYALRRDGSLEWRTRVAGPVSSSPLVHGSMVIFGDLTGTIYALDRRTGAIRWRVKPNPHPKAAVWASAIPVGDRV